MSIKDIIRGRYEAQKLRVDVPTKCPHCGKKIKFNLEHTQNTTVDTKLLSIEKE